MSWVAVAIAGSAIVGGVASNNAANKQKNAANRAADIQQQQFNTIQGNQRPYIQAGGNAVNKLQSLLGIKGTAPTAPNRENFTIHSGPQGGGGPMSKFDPIGAFANKEFGNKAPYGDILNLYGPAKSSMLGMSGQPGTKDSFDQSGFDQASQQYQTDLQQYNDNLNSPDFGSLTHQFNAGDLNSNLAPNWQFALSQGQGATQNLANRGGGLLSGNTLKGISDYTINKSGDLYQQAFQNFTSNQTNIFNRLASIAGLGQTANQAVGNQGVQTGLNVGNAIQNAGAAGAAGIVGGANAISGGVGNAASWYGINNILNQPKAMGPDTFTANAAPDPTAGFSYG